MITHSHRYFIHIYAKIDNISPIPATFQFNVNSGYADYLFSWYLKDPPHDVMGTDFFERLAEI
jgi:hypothetical protein